MNPAQATSSTSAVVVATLAAALAAHPSLAAKTEEELSGAVTDELAEGWAYPAPALWYAEFRTAESEFALVQARWIRARTLSQNGAITRGELAHAAASYTALRTSLLAQRGYEEQKVREVETALQNARGQVALGSADANIRNEAIIDLQRQIGEAAARADQATRSALSHLQSVGRAATMARDALSAWWSLHLDLARERDLMQPSTDDLARLDNARLKVDASLEGLDAPSRSLADIALRAADQEIALRLQLATLSIRSRSADDPMHQQSLQEDVRDLERVALAHKRQLDALDEAIDRVERDIASLQLDAPPTPEEEAFQALRTEVMTLNATYSRLYLGMASLDARIEMDAWCKVHVHGALVRTMLGLDGAPGLLQNAAAAYGGTCGTVMADLLEVPSFAALWAEALLRLHLAEPAYLQMDIGPGVWTLDGTPLVGGGAAVFTVAPGVHRIEYNQDGRVIPSSERIDPGEQLCVGLTQQEQIALVSCPMGSASAGPGLLPRTPYSAHLPPVVSQEVTPRPRTFVAASGQWLRFPGYDDTPLDMLGGNVEVAWRLGRRPRSMWHLSFQQDVARSPAPLALSDTLRSDLLLREQVAISAIPDLQVVSPVFEVGGGFVVSFHRAGAEQELLAPPMLLHVGVGAHIALSPRLSALSSVTLVQTFWSDGGFSPLPTFRIGVARWM